MLSAQRQTVNVSSFQDAMRCFGLVEPAAPSPAPRYRSELGSAFSEAAERKASVGGTWGETDPNAKPAAPVWPWVVVLGLAALYFGTRPAI
jgi:hypothetical protein